MSQSGLWAVVAPPLVERTGVWSQHLVTAPLFSARASASSMGLTFSTWEKVGGEKKSIFFHTNL